LFACDVDGVLWSDVEEIRSCLWRSPGTKPCKHRHLRRYLPAVCSC